MEDKALSRYFSILSGKEKPKFIMAKQSRLLDEKIKEAEKILENCELCERKCKVNRLKQKSFCQLQDKMLISSYFDHYGEEFFLVPSFTIFFWSCNFSCQYCQNYTISQRLEKPQEMTGEDITKIINQQKHCKNINFVGGEPTPQLPFILKILSLINIEKPIVWNSNFYMSTKTLELLRGVVDIYLSDFKYGNDECAEKLSKVKNYTHVVRRNHLLAAKDSDSEIVVRHLILPSHVECCSKPILKWIASNLGKQVIVNIMEQYVPHYNAYKFLEINRNVSEEEFEEVINYAKKLRLNFIN